MLTSVCGLMHWEAYLESFGMAQYVIINVCRKLDGNAPLFRHMSLPALIEQKKNNLHSDTGELGYQGRNTISRIRRCTDATYR